MKRAGGKDRISRVALISAAFVAGALTLAVFFHGPQVPLLAGAQILLIAWLALSIGASYSNGVHLPLNPLSISLTAFWVWLGISILWSRVPATSIMTFWWVGSLPLVYWCYSLSEHRDRIWFYVSRFAILGAVLLCAYAWVQIFVWEQPPRSTFVNIHSFAALIVLMALPLSAYFLYTLHRRTQRPMVLAVGAILGFLLFTVALTNGRGTSLSLLIGAVVLAALTVRQVGAKNVAIYLGLLLAMYLCAMLTLQGGLSGSRLTTLVDPASAGFQRFVIWKASWTMLMDNPWWGIGLGTYYLLWPPYRDPTDNTLGFFVHNDYLQLWIETGLPGLLLLLAVFGSVLYLLIRAVGGNQFSVERRLEMVGLFSGLLAAAAHSFLDFNFYIFGISILAGLILGRFQDGTFDTASRWMIFRPHQSMQLHAFRTVVVLLGLFPAAYLIALGASDYFYHRGFDLALHGELQKADGALTYAERLMPADDKVLLAHADLYRHAIQQLPKTAKNDRQALYDVAVAMLDEASATNPYRALIDTLRGNLIEDNRDLAGHGWFERAESAYKRALVMNPRFFGPRMSYARILLERGQEGEAYAVLEDGMKHWYHPDREVLRYYQFTADLAGKLGKSDRVREIERQMEDLRVEIANLAPVRPFVKEPGVR